MNHFVVLSLGLLALLPASLMSCKQSKPDQRQASVEAEPADAIHSKVSPAGGVDTLLPESSFIYKMVYYAASEDMTLYFQGNREKPYHYQKVPEEVWLKFKLAPSKGRFFSEHIREEKSYQMKQ